MNVAMTRAKRMLVMVGDSGTISQDEFYSKFLDFVDKEQAYRSAWEFMQ
jgi:ATP-dependent RNA/DNA helicase IGHMBP2